MASQAVIQGASDLVIGNRRAVVDSHQVAPVGIGKLPVGNADRRSQFPGGISVFPLIHDVTGIVILVSPGSVRSLVILPDQLTLGIVDIGAAYTSSVKNL